MEMNNRFYDDPEIYHPFSSFDQNPMSNSKILSFPTKDSGAFAASFPTENLVDFNPLSLVVSWMSSGEDIAALTGSVETKRPIITGTVSSPQVSMFWELYQAYPKYLKNVQKRQKRRNRKRTKQEESKD